MTSNLDKRLSFVNAAIADLRANIPPDPTRFMAIRELAYIEHKMAIRYGPGTDSAQPYIDYLDDSHPLINHPQYTLAGNAINVDMSEQECSDIWQRLREQPWRSGRRVNRNG